MNMNWAQNITFSDEKYLTPTSLEEVQEAVRCHTHVRPRGTTHCFNHLADTHATALSLQHMPVIYELDQVALTVRVNAAQRYGDLAPRLQADGCALHNLLSLPHTSIAGAVCTGSHGKVNIIFNITSFYTLHCPFIDISIPW